MMYSTISLSFRIFGLLLGARCGKRTLMACSLRMIMSVGAYFGFY